MQPVIRFLFTTSLALGCAAAFAADKPNPATRDQVVEVPAGAKTGDAADRSVLAAARRAVVRDKSLSTAAHNVKMEANAGVITISGDVRNAAEKGKVEALVRKTPGVTGVESKITLKTATTASAKPRTSAQERARTEKAEKTK